MPAASRACIRPTFHKHRFPLLSAYDYVLKCSNTFNLLDARGAISVTERVGVIARVRKLAVGVAQAWMEQTSSEAAMPRSKARRPSQNESWVLTGNRSRRSS